ncbi:MAG: hypothetical protein LQ352_008134 [Teloschistes flavicans]|nr:MAG: hypothetical protein LQ352_008134 [Teloschistes flavicans]
MPHFSPLCGIVTTIVAAMAGLFVAFETGLVPVSSGFGVPRSAVFPPVPAFPAPSPAAMPVNLADDVFSRFFSSSAANDMFNMSDNASVFSVPASAPAADDMFDMSDNAPVCPLVSSAPAADDMFNMSDNAPVCSLVCSAPAADDMLNMSDNAPVSFGPSSDSPVVFVVTLEPLPVPGPVNFCAADDEPSSPAADDIFNVSDNDMFDILDNAPVSSDSSSDSPLVVVVAFEPTPVPGPANFSAVYGKPSSSTTTTPPPPVNPTRYPGFFRYLSWGVCYATSCMVFVLTHFLCTWQDSLKQHPVIPPRPAVVVIKKRTAEHPEGAELSEVEVMRLYGFSSALSSSGAFFALSSSDLPAGLSSALASSGAFSVPSSSDLPCGLFSVFASSGAFFALASSDLPSGLSSALSSSGAFSIPSSSDLPCGLFSVRSSSGAFSVSSSDLPAGLSSVLSSSGAFSALSPFGLFSASPSSASLSSLSGGLVFANSFTNEAEHGRRGQLLDFPALRGLPVVFLSGLQLFLGDSDPLLATPSTISGLVLGNADSGLATPATMPTDGPLNAGQRRGPAS